jgi:sarcosine oxidase, subunit gamma
MAETPQARSPLAHLAAPAGAATVTMRELAFRGLVDLRLDARDRGAWAAVESALVVTLPEANRSAACTAGSILWLGPDEFLLVTEPGRETALAVTLSAALRGRRAAVVDMTDSRTTIALSGRRARDLLAKGCGLDLHPRSFAPGHCAQSFLAKIKIALHQIDDAPTYHVIVERSVAEYLWLWLADAATEFTARPS